GGGREPVILLDTDLPENAPEDRRITDHLYGGDAAYRLKQEIVLGIGGVRMLEALGFRVIGYHLNEGHSSLLTLQLLRRHAYSPEDVRPGESRYDVPRVRDLCHFTTHTPVEAGHDRFPYHLVQPILGEIVDGETLRRYAGASDLNTTRLALNLSEYVNGVAKRHAETSRKLFPGYAVNAITNGIHPGTWAHPQIASLYDRHIPGWRIEPEHLMRADCSIPDRKSTRLNSSHVKISYAGRWYHRDRPSVPTRRSSDLVNGVAKRHAETSRKLFPGYAVNAITNGIHPGTWAHPQIASLYDRHIPGWRIEPEHLMRADCSI